MFRPSSIRTPAIWATALALSAGFLPRAALADEQPATMMSAEHEVNCYGDQDGRIWRVQCDSSTKVCLYAPDAVLDENGEPARKLQRARYCPMRSEPFDPAAWQARGYTMKRALADAPYGWTRDARGRVMQVNFDLTRRMYLGGGYAPTAVGLSEIESGKRANIDFGLLILEMRLGRTRHRLHLVEGDMFLAPFSADVVLLHYDFSRRYRDPVLRITSFFGTPRRHDFSFNLGAWLEAGRLEIRSGDGVQDRLWEMLTVNGTVDLWQSKDLYSYVRLRGGLGFETASLSTDQTTDGRRAAITPGGALEADITFDRAGFHHLGLEIGYENPFYTTVDARVGESARRMNASVEYEMIFLAINDQPLSLHLEVGAENRNDSPIIPARWTARANAGLRFSLWAPARQP